MTNKLLVFFIFVLFLILLSPPSISKSYAEGSSSASAGSTKKLDSIMRKESSKVNEEFRQKLALIKDGRKKKIVENLSTKIPAMNKHATNRMTEVLTRLQKRLDMLLEKITKAKSEGKDTTSAESAYSKANTDLTAAIAAVSAQSAKTYSITLTTEDALRLAIGPVIKQLRANLKLTHSSVVTALKSIKSAEKEVRKLLPEMENKEASQAAE